MEKERSYLQLWTMLICFPADQYFFSADASQILIAFHLPDLVHIQTTIRYKAIFSQQQVLRKKQSFTTAKQAAAFKHKTHFVFLSH